MEKIKALDTNINTTLFKDLIAIDVDASITDNQRREIGNIGIDIISEATMHNGTMLLMLNYEDTNVTSAKDAPNLNDIYNKIVCEYNITSEEYEWLKNQMKSLDMDGATYVIIIPEKLKKAYILYRCDSPSNVYTNNAKFYDYFFTEIDWSTDLQVFGGRSSNEHIWQEAKEYIDAKENENE